MHLFLLNRHAASISLPLAHLSPRAPFSPQTIQYIEPHEADKLSQAELLVVDEAAAIPLPTVKRLLGPYLVFLASTINGYEGTGRSLSLKLLQQLRIPSTGGGGGGGAAGASFGALPGAAGGAVGRSFREVTLAEPIRYNAGDPIEKWLNGGCEWGGEWLRIRSCVGVITSHCFYLRPSYSPPPPPPIHSHRPALPGRHHPLPAGRPPARTL